MIANQPAGRKIQIVYTMTFKKLSDEEAQEMAICDRLRELRRSKNLSQGDIEKRTGLLHSYISRVENGHTVPAVETLEKFARALEVPLYRLFYNGERPPHIPNLLKRKSSHEIVWGSNGKDALYLHKLVKCLSKAGDKDRKILLSVAQKLVSSRNRVALTDVIRPKLAFLSAAEAGPARRIRAVRKTPSATML